MLCVGGSQRAPGLVVAWLSAFGAFRALLLAAPYAILLRRCRARGAPPAVAVALLFVPGAMARLCLAYFAGTAASLAGSTTGVL